MVVCHTYRQRFFETRGGALRASSAITYAAPNCLAQVRILIVREANFEEANLDSRRQILTRFLRDLHASPGPDTPPDSTLTGPPLFRWSFRPPTAWPTDQTSLSRGLMSPPSFSVSSGSTHGRGGGVMAAT